MLKKLNEIISYLDSVSYKYEMLHRLQWIVEIVVLYFL